MVTKVRILSLTAATFALSVGVLGLAHADNTAVDGDAVAVGDQVPQTTVNLGTVCLKDAPVSTDVEIWAVRSGGTGPGNNRWSDSASLTASKSGQVITTGSASIAFTPPSAPILLPAHWLSLGSNSKSDSIMGGLTLDPGSVVGAFSAQVTYALSGEGTLPGGEIGMLVRTSAVTYTATFSDTGACAAAPVNNAPTKPGTPAATPGSPNQGGFTLNWAASTDAESNPFTYTLEGRDANDAAFSTIASGLTTNSYAFAAGSPAEGTWTYRVKAVETTASPTLSSVYSDTSPDVLVDRTGPNPPMATADRTPDYSDGIGDWWRNSVTVSFGGNGDPGLPDGSAGSGVKDVTAAQTYSATGPFTASGTSTDNAANVSTSTSLSGDVDATIPVVSLSCPSTPVIQGTTAYATWSASDVGSGVNGTASGQIPLDSTTVGSTTAHTAAGFARDNVGLESAATSCTYSVVYDWHGFYRPVDNPTVVNKVKAGSAIPVKFSLNADPVLGNQGLDILNAGSPSSQQVSCSTSSVIDLIEETVTSGGSSLAYDPLANQYVYVWKTDKAWASSCRVLSVKLRDGTTHTANFQFTK